MPKKTTGNKRKNKVSTGLERTFRLFQSIVQILSYYALPFDILISLLSLTPNGSPSPAATQTVLLIIRQRLALARRYFRLFRFLECFHAAQSLYSSISSPAAATAAAPKSAAEKGNATQPVSPWSQTEAYLDVFGKTFNGMYLLLEAATFLEAQRVPGLAVWTPEWERTITVEGQRFWLFALVCSVFSGLLKMVNVLAYTPVPEGYATAAATPQPAKLESSEEKPPVDDGGDGEEDRAKWEMKQEQLRLRSMVQGRKLGREEWRRDVRAKVRKLGRGVVSNAIDITLPGSIVGWVRVSDGTVGLASFVTTILTGAEVWERCGREVAGGN